MVAGGIPADAVRYEDFDSLVPDLFRTWNGDGEERWVRYAWSLLERDGLACVDEGEDRSAVIVRLVALSALQRALGEATLFACLYASARDATFPFPIQTRAEAGNHGVAPGRPPEVSGPAIGGAGGVELPRPRQDGACGVRSERLGRIQVPVYLGALEAGAAAGLAVPAIARPAEHAITPVLGLLLYATFLGVPFSRTCGALRDTRFLLTVLAVNFVAAPAAAWAASRMLVHDEALLTGALLVLLTRCVDYVIVFTGLGGGAWDRLLAAVPLLMLAQMALLPVGLWLFAGPEFASAVDLAPFVRAFLLLIVLPLTAAWWTQTVARRRPMRHGRAEVRDGDDGASDGRHARRRRGLDDRRCTFVSR